MPPCGSSFEPQSLRLGILCLAQAADRGGFLSVLAPLLLCHFVLPAAAADENWTRFRGPNGSGYVADVLFPAAWGEDNYTWKAALSGKGHSSPIGWRNKLFITSGDEATGEVIVAALDAATGDELWSRRYPSQPHSLHPSNSYASSTPAADERAVYVSWASPEALEMAAISHDNEELWRLNLGPIDNNHGFGVSPIVVDDLVILANDHSGPSFVVAVDRATGDERWRCERSPGTPSYATPALFTTPNGERQLIVCSTSAGMAALSLRNGRVLWQAPGVFPVRCVGSPLVAGGLVIATSGEGGNGKSFTAVRPALSPRDQPTVAYDLRKSLPQVPTCVAKEDLLFLWSDRGVVTCCDLASGKVHWSERVGGNYYGSPVIAGDMLYGIAADGQVVVLAAAHEYELLGRSSLGEPSHASPTIHQGRMYLRTEKSVACLPGAVK